VAKDQRRYDRAGAKSEDFRAGLSRSASRSQIFFRTPIRAEEMLVPTLLEACPLMAEPTDLLLDVFARHRPGWLAMIRRNLGGAVLRRHDPEDVMQEAEVRVRGRAGRFADWVTGPHFPGEDLEGAAYYWLDRAVRDTLRSVFRRDLGPERDARRDAAVPDLSGEHIANKLFAAGLTPSGEVRRRELIQKVRDTIARMKPEDQEILNLRFLAEMTTAEVAEQLGLKDTAVRARHGRAMTRFAELWGA
jgi:RNA polymerase sigma factor (sigma-70 family)